MIIELVACDFHSNSLNISIQSITFAKILENRMLALTSEIIIIESDEDLEIVSTITAEYNSKKNFVVEYYCINHEKGRKVIDYTATVDKENTAILAKRLKVDPINLPQVIYDEFGDCTGTSRLSDIEYVFKEILDFILDRGVKYKLSSK